MSRIRRLRRLTRIERLAAWLALALVAALDAHGPHAGQHADVFSWAVAAFGFITDVASIVIGGVEVALGAAVSWLVAVVGWIGTKLADIVVSTGSIFSKTWDALEGLWTDVVKPALSWLSDVVTRFARWLENFIKPLLDWARAVRDELISLYKTFLKPILDALTLTRNVLDILAKLHVPFAAALDGYVTQLESWLTEAYLKVLREVNTVMDTLSGLFTLDGLLQRFVLIRSIQRDWHLVQRSLLNPMRKPLDDTQSARLNAAWNPQPAADLHAALGAYLDGQSNDTGDTVDANVARAEELWDALDDSEAA